MFSMWQLRVKDHMGDEAPVAGSKRRPLLALLTIRCLLSTFLDRYLCHVDCDW